MIVLLPPSETKRPGGDGPPLRLADLSTPALRPLRAELVDELVALAADREASRRALGLSPSQDAEIERNAALRSATKSRELQHRMDALRSVSLFTQLTDEECGRVAEHLVYAPFVAGDVLTRQGAIAHWLYIILAGEADVVRRDAEGEEHALARLKPGDFFGEMGLLTGEPRTASVHAVTDVECYRLDKTGLAEIMADRPAIAEELSAVLAARSQQNEAAAANGDPRRKVAPAGLGGAIVGRIRSFFNLE